MTHLITLFWISLVGLFLITPLFIAIQLIPVVIIIFFMIITSMATIKQKNLVANIKSSIRLHIIVLRRLFSDANPVLVLIFAFFVLKILLLMLSAANVYLDIFSAHCSSPENWSLVVTNSVNPAAANINNVLVLESSYQGYTSLPAMQFMQHCYEIWSPSAASFGFSDTTFNGWYKVPTCSFPHLHVPWSMNMPISTSFRYFSYSPGHVGFFTPNYMALVVHEHCSPCYTGDIGASYYEDSVV